MNTSTTNSPSAVRAAQALPRPARLARLGWLALALLLAGLFALAVPPRYAELAAAEAHALPPGWSPAGWPAALARVGLMPAHYAAYQLGLEVALAAGFFLAAWLVAWRGAGGSLAPYTAATLILNGLLLLPVAAALPAARPEWAPVVLGLRALALVALAGLYYLFPTGRWVPRWTRWLLCAWAGYQAASVAFPALATPLTFADAARPVGRWALALNLAWLATGAAAQWQRLRLAGPGPRAQQSKWLLYGTAVAALGSLGVALPMWWLPMERLPGRVGVLYALAAVPAAALLILAWPASLALAALRRRLWMADFVINRTVVYGGVVLVVGAVFGITLLAAASRLPEEPVLTFALAALLAGVLWRPARHRLRRLVDQHLYGIGIDYRASVDELDAEYTAARLAGYTRLEALRLGGLGTGYRAQSPSLPRPVVLKVLPAYLAADAAFVARFREVMSAAAELQHPHLARVYEAGEAGGRLYVASEYLVGQDLSSFLLINGRLSPGRALPLLRDLAAALDYAHAHGQVHGDVRLANVMLVLREHELAARDARFPARAAFLPTTAFRTVLLNVGLARALESGRRTEALAYAAPEQVRGDAPDARTDVYALGALAYLMLAGQLPFQHYHPGALALAQLHQPAPDPRRRVASLAPEIAAALLRALAKDPDERFQSAGEFVAALGAGEPA